MVGRKNWLFSDQPDGAWASAILYSIIETAKANGLEPYNYLLYLFDRLPFVLRDDDEEALRELLPYNLAPEELKTYRKEYFYRKGSHLM